MHNINIRVFSQVKGAVIRNFLNGCTENSEIIIGEDEDGEFEKEASAWLKSAPDNARASIIKVEKLEQLSNYLTNYLSQIDSNSSSKNLVIYGINHWIFLTDIAKSIRDIASHGIDVAVLSATTDDESPEDDEWEDYFLAEEQWFDEFESGRYTEAISYLDLLISQNKDNPDPKYYLCRGVSNYYVERYAEAIVDFEKTITSVRHRLEIRLERGIDLTQAEIDTAKQWVEDAVRGKTSALIKLGRAVEAKRYYRSQLKQEIKKAWQSKNLLETANKLRELCLLQLSSPTQIKVDSLQATAGINHAIEGDYKSAVAQFDALIAADPHNYGAYFNRAAVKAIQGSVREAIADLDRAIAIEPESIEARLSKSAIWQINGYTSKSKACYREALNLMRNRMNASLKSQNYPEYLNYLRKLYFQKVKYWLTFLEPKDVTITVWGAQLMSIALLFCFCYFHPLDLFRSGLQEKFLQHGLDDRSQKVVLCAIQAQYLSVIPTFAILIKISAQISSKKHLLFLLMFLALYLSIPFLVV